MGLIKKFRQRNGMTAEYHRINTIIKNDNDITVSVYSYVDKETRLREEQIRSWKKRFDKILEELDNDGLAELIKEVGDDYHEVKEFGDDYTVYKGDYHFDYIDDLNRDASMANIYTVLSKTPPFDGAVPDNDA